MMGCLTIFLICLVGCAVFAFFFGSLLFHSSRNPGFPGPAVCTVSWYEKVLLSSYGMTSSAVNVKMRIFLYVLHIQNDLGFAVKQIHNERLKVCKASDSQ